MGLLLGAAIGLVSGLLYAPKSGRETKQLIKEKAEEITGRAAEVVEKAIAHLRNRSELRQILKHCVEINRLENVADDIYRSATGELFDKPPDIAAVIKWREIYEYMESATDRCEDVADVLEGVALKHA